ncbi:predicted protein [Botrytis cinerea T4]|uniref:Uncharacterized protein n=1 Tax=Botryotinia fuckeliana (strain T4) TaxID=999810 RepID=G2YMV9_BOTF4|nr:predicted protein [Botrytis cinerea T4]
MNMSGILKSSGDPISNSRQRSKDQEQCIIDAAKSCS